MTEFKKEITIPHIPIWINQWIQENFDESIYEKYLEASNIHQQVVQSAIDAGDCVVTEGDGVNDSMRIHWASEKIHVEYMAKIPKDSHDFYTAMWALYYKAADTNVQINLQE